MSEKLYIANVKEILRPQNTPEMGFASYTMLEGNKATREKTKDDFITGKIINPHLDYPRLDVDRLNIGTRRLQNILDIADSVNGNEERLAIWNSAAYRIAMMYYLKSLAYLQDVIEEGGEELIKDAAIEHQRLNEQLYGELSPELTESLFGEIIAQINSKNLTDSSKKILEDLKNGFKVEIVGEEIEVPAVYIESDKRLPEIDRSSLLLLKEVLTEEYQDIFEIVNRYYDEVISNRTEGEQVFTPPDMYELFAQLQAISHDAAKVNIIFDEDATRMSWDTERMAIIIGGRRANIKSKEIMITKMIHEYGVHAIRAVKGEESEFPVLGTGMFTELEDSHQFDYSIFEEGLASICEFAILPDKLKWDPIDLEKTAVIALAYRGLNFRQIYETLWRIRSLLKSKDGEDIKQNTVNTAKRNSYVSVERVFRGTPTDLPRINTDGTQRIITYNKDLVYLPGKLSALEYIKSATVEDIRFALKGKFDPTNPKQLALARKYL
jgi:hypothetical protein